MKFPLRERPFPRVSLTPQQCDAYESLLHTVVDATLEEHQRFVRYDNRVLDRKLWKAVKHRDDVSVFKRVNRAPPAARGRRRTVLQQPAEHNDWRMPKMIAVGTIAGALDDIMYGIVTPDAASIVVKTSYVHDELVDSAVLHTMRGATTEDPFQYTGLKWIVKANCPSVQNVIKPRDFVFVESTGVRTFHNGVRMGFHALHSVDHAQCPSLEGIVRGKFSSCYLYFQKSPGTVEVYMMSYVEPGGNAPEAVAVLSAANTMIGIWKSVWCAQNKMLAYLLTNALARRKFRAATVQTATVSRTTSKHARCCNVCTKSFGSFRTVKGCQLCTAWVCSKCRIARTISFSDETLQLTQRVVEVCKSCVAHVAVADTFSAATVQYVAASIEEDKPVVETPTPKTLEAKRQPRRPRYYSNESSGTQPGSLRSLGDFSGVNSWRDDDELDEPRTRSRETSDAESVAMETIDDWDHHRKSLTMYSTPECRTSSPVRAKTASFQSPTASDLDDDEHVMDYQQRLMRTMQSLCHTAEQTYQITSLTGSLVQESNMSTRNEWV